jgi:hypothetical protein
MGSAMCGGVISLTQLNKDIKKYGVWADMMCWVMADKQYKKYVALLKQEKNKEAHILFEQYAYSQI